MQLHIVGTDTAAENIQAKQELAVVLNFLGIHTVVEERFSGMSGAGVVLVAPADVAGIDSTCPVLLLDLNGDITGDMTGEVVGLETGADIAPVGIIRTPLALEQLGSALRAVRARHSLQAAPQLATCPLRTLAQCGAARRSSDPRFASGCHRFYR